MQKYPVAVCRGDIRVKQPVVADEQFEESGEHPLPLDAAFDACCRWLNANHYNVPGIQFPIFHLTVLVKVEPPHMLAFVFTISPDSSVPSLN